MGVPNKEINFIWTGRSVGNCTAAIITGVVFRLERSDITENINSRRFVKQPWQKLAFLAVCILASGAFGFAVPLVSQLSLLILALLGSGFFIGCFNTANNSLVVYMLGPDRCLTPPPADSQEPGPRPTSRACTPSLQLASYSVSSSPGSPPPFPGSLVVQPFFPTDVNIDDICNHASVSVNTTVVEVAGVEVADGDVLDSVPYLAWPFIFISGCHLLPVLGLILISESPQNFLYFHFNSVVFRLVMPHFYEDETEIQKDSNFKDSSVRYPNLIVFLAFFFFVFSCGIESSFHSQSFTFGLCGPHSLTPHQVSLLSSSSPSRRPLTSRPSSTVSSSLEGCVVSSSLPGCAPAPCCLLPTLGESLFTQTESPASSVSPPGAWPPPSSWWPLEAGSWRPCMWARPSLASPSQCSLDPVDSVSFPDVPLLWQATAGWRSR